MVTVDQEEYIEQLKTLVNIESGSYNAAGINRVADQLETWYRELGWYIQRHNLGPQTGNLLEISNRPADHYDVMFVGHMDTVYPDGTVAQRPFSSDGVRAYGPGAGDMKNGDAAMFQVAKHLSSSILEKLNICMVYSPDEEIGSIYSQEKLDEIGSRSSFIYVMESCDDHNCHCFARKGRMHYVIRFHGQAAHAGYMFEMENASAVLEMGHYIVKLMGLSNRKENTTVNVGIAKGGTAANVVADFAEIWVEMRFKKDSERERLAREINRLIQSAPFVPGVQVEIVSHEAAAAWTKTPASLKHIAHIRDIAQKLNIEFNEQDRGGLSDANHLSQCGNICGDGFGPHGALIHSEKEFTVIDSVQPCVRLLCAVLKDLAEQK
ncbi:M20 family peptidase [Pseudoflavonifractor sp. 60]|uniref:M20 family metallopeptidase n=1 Tax=Pseudoflavonifractor sp. 60 TaxID=2304576 RepID=UPI0013719122|nr:M20 family metallopeptidase [Pseudoflavonifractor sp. 60]NBI67923.1 M20 family peptidase [Pseudoflavonifractor sp. 60]